MAPLQAQRRPRARQTCANAPARLSPYRRQKRGIVWCWIPSADRAAARESSWSLFVLRRDCKMRACSELELCPRSVCYE